LANSINKAFLEPLEEYHLFCITRLALEKKSPGVPKSIRRTCSENTIETQNSILTGFLVAFCENTPILLLFLYAEFSTHRLKSLPRSWKLADVAPLPMKKPVQILKKDLRPFSLTPCVSKVAEEFVVRDYIMPTVLNNLDMNRFGAVPKSSTTFTLIDMLHDLTKGADQNGATIRTILFDYREVFYLIDHSILIKKLCKLNVPNNIINWIIEYLSDRSQRIKLGEECVSQ